MDVHESLVLPPAPPTDRVPPEIREMVAAYRVELTDGRVLTLLLDRGTLRIEDRPGEADCRLRCTPEMLHQILNGELNLVTALMRGDVRVAGDLETGKRLYRYLRLANAREELHGHGQHPRR